MSLDLNPLQAGDRNLHHTRIIIHRGEDARKRRECSIRHAANTVLDCLALEDERAANAFWPVDLIHANEQVEILAGLGVLDRVNKCPRLARILGWLEGNRRTSEMFEVVWSLVLRMKR